jgi:hypothetical protein
MVSVAAGIAARGSNARRAGAVAAAAAAAVSLIAAVWVMRRH